MSTFVTAHTYAHTVNHVATSMLLSLRELIRRVGLDPGKLVQQWGTLESGISVWLTSQHLLQVTLEIFAAKTGELMSRWDISPNYAYGGNGSFWADIAALQYAIPKAGPLPPGCDYKILVKTAPGAPNVAGWTTGSFLSTSGLAKYGVGATIGADGISGETSYWRKR